MRELKQVKKIILHCAYTPPEMDIGVEEIRGWHVNERKWDDIGYHGVIRRGGAFEQGRSMAYQGAHVSGQNGDSLGLCLVGGKASKAKPGGLIECNFDAEQWDTLTHIVKVWMRRYGLTPDHVFGHNDFANKHCPTFDVIAWREGLR